MPTPLHDAPRLAASIGVKRLLIKRDDLTGFAGGGNKVRKLEFLVGDALARDADTLIAVGGPQSNAVRTAMIAARVAGLDPIAVLYGDPPATHEGNLLLDSLAGARLVFTGGDRLSTEPASEALAAELRGAGKRPYLLPRGGATPVGDAAYVQAAMELNEQLEAIGADAAAVVLATGSCGTQAGLIAGLVWLEARYRAVGILVSRARSEAEPRILALARATAALLKLDVAIEPGAVVVEEGYMGPGFGLSSPAGDAALELALRTEGLILDPVYTAKAMAGLAGMVAGGTIPPDATLVFLHTGGEPALYARHRQFRHGPLASPSTNPDLVDA